MLLHLPYSHEDIKYSVLIGRQQWNVFKLNILFSRGGLKELQHRVNRYLMSTSNIQWNHGSVTGTSTH